ncbi:MAG TPA: response regulator, partial [Myxococcales bacterium]|nr:response regulator [Myxococcales bacterium]
QQCIAVVDDDACTRMILRRCMERAGHRVVEAENGRELLRLVAGESLDLAILNVFMPILDGIQACRQLRKTTTGLLLPILFTTNVVDLETTTLCFDAGGNDLVHKPFQLQQLMAVVQGLLADKLR